MIIKCKMCGGDMELTPDKTFGTCEFCGSTMTLPRIDDDQRAAAFNRGNHFRRIGEFDKALAVYERIVREDDTDAEAHWCCALCRFGIEYVEDPHTYEWMPTCHRASFDSFLEDVDYQAALTYSEGLTHRQYVRDGAKIAEVQRGILATSQNAEPYDVFICYKESDANGDRTRDSLMAQDIYYQLTEQGRKVFFARITLEDVAGTQYEPYIFAALNSAKVMIVVGTKPEHLNAVWVKNEWSRFLAMMKKDRQKLLLPCYRDMDPYDLPEALSVLQSYDMSKIGFIQDLTRGISKVLDAEKKPDIVQTADSQSSNAKSSALLERGFMALEDGEWENADGFFEEVLNQDARCAQAYLGKLLSQLQLSKASCLSDCNKAVMSSNHYQKILRFGDEELINELQTHAKNNRKAMLRNAESLLRAGEWNRADRLCDVVLEEDETCVAAYVGKLLAGIKVHRLEELDSYCGVFWETNPNYAKIMQYADAELIGRIEASIEKIKGNIKEDQAHQKIYEEAVSITLGSAEISYLERLYGVKAGNQAKEEDLIAAAELLDTIPDYRDAAALAVKYRSKAEDIRKENVYIKAVHAATSPNREILEEAIQIFETIRDYKDAAERIDDCRQKMLRLEDIMQKEEYMRRGCCRYCGGEFKGWFTKTCSACGKEKDYY